MNSPYRCGYIALVGRPNVGKSTLLNKLLGFKLSITSRKPQTTRHRILGIKTKKTAQLVFVDTPGIHKGGSRALQQHLNRAARSILQDMNVIVLLVEAMHWNEEDELALEACKQADCPVILAINKIDTVKEKDALLPYIDELTEKYEFECIVPISAKNNQQLESLENEIEKRLPQSEPFYSEDQITDRSASFVAAEMIREKLVRLLGDELPYETTVEIEKFEDTNKLLKIYAVIWVERDNQKAIVIGKQGARLKQIGQQAREELESFFDKKVYLQTWVKIKKGWSDSERALQQLGYKDEL
jgi:GTP-binding protein Era